MQGSGEKIMTGKLGMKVDTHDPSPSPEMKHMSTSTSVGTVTEPDCLGPCEPGTSVTLEGIVWQETEGGVLVVNVTWRGKTYVGTLLDCTKHDWAPPRFCESPVSDIETKTNKVSRAKRSRASVVDSTPDLRNVPSKLRNGKGRRTANSGFTIPASPNKCETSNGSSKRKTRLDLELSPAHDTSKNGKKNSVQPRNTPTPNTPTSDSPSSQSTFSAWIECPEPNCSKKYKHINGLKYHQRAHRKAANDGSCEIFGKHENDSAELEPSKESTAVSDGEDANQESLSVPPSPSFKFVLKSRLGVVDAASSNSDLIHINNSTEEPSSDRLSDGAIAPSILKDANNQPSSEVQPSSSASSSNLHHVSSNSSTIVSINVSSGKTASLSSSSNPISSTHSATFLVPGTSSQTSSVTQTDTSSWASNIGGSRISEKVKVRNERSNSCNNDKFYKVTPGPSGLSISVSPLLSNSSGSSPKHALSTSSPSESSQSKSSVVNDSNTINLLKKHKHKTSKHKKKKSKHKERDDKDRKQSSTHFLSNTLHTACSPSAENSSLPPLNSFDEDDLDLGSQNSPKRGEPLNTSLPSFPTESDIMTESTLNTVDQNKRSTLSDSILETAETEDATDKLSNVLNTDTSTIENVQSPAYSDISDANDTDADMKNSSLDKNTDHPGLSLRVSPEEVAKLSNSSNYGMYSFLNQTPFMVSVDQKNEDSSLMPEKNSVDSIQTNSSSTHSLSQLNSSLNQNKTSPPPATSSSTHFSSHLSSDSLAPTQPPRLIKTISATTSKKSGSDFSLTNDGNLRKSVSGASSDNFLDRPSEISGPNRAPLPGHLSASSSTVPSVDAPNFPSPSFGMYSYLNQPPFMMPMGQKNPENSRLSEQSSIEQSRLNHLPSQNLSQSSHQQSQSQAKNPSPKHHPLHLGSDSVTPLPPRLIKTPSNLDTKKGVPEFNINNDGPRKKSSDSSKEDNQMDRQNESVDLNRNQPPGKDLPSTSSNSSAPDFSSRSFSGPIQYISQPLIQHYGWNVDPFSMNRLINSESILRQQQQQYQKMVLEENKRYPHPFFPYPMRFDRK